MAKASKAAKALALADMLEAAMTVLAEQGWDRLSMREIAERLGVTADRVYAFWPTKWHILKSLAQEADRAMLAEGPADGDSVRERLFDLIMRRFDALEPYKDGLTRAFNDARDPLTLAAMLPDLALSMRWVLDAAGVRVDGPFGPLRIAALAAAYGMVVRAWLKDDSPDLGTTMAALDKALDRLETLANSFDRPRRTAPHPDEPTAAPDA